jgi:sigma-B regulation protein RsbU (phosphoserine phosphatase)
MPPERSALRAYALATDHSAEVLTSLDRKVHHFEAGSMTTVRYALI